VEPVVSAVHMLFGRVVPVSVAVIHTVMSVLSTAHLEHTLTVSHCAHVLNVRVS
jgi:hypothetical protein